jgi:L-aspartate oxidase
MGGIKTSSWGETSIAGLFAAGETACTGVHGANRLASNSMLEVVVFSKRIMQKAASGERTRLSQTHRGAEMRLTLRPPAARKPTPAPGLAPVQQLHWDKVGLIRDRESLTQAAEVLAAWYQSLPPPADRPSHELHNLVLTGRLVTEAALLREESRGAHFRSDFPKRSRQWQRHIVFTDRG